jgi:hypothetical protein
MQIRRRDAHVCVTSGEVAAAMEREVEEGHRAAQIDAHDLIEVLQAVADRLDPPVAP